MNRVLLWVTGLYLAGVPVRDSTAPGNLAAGAAGAAGIIGITRELVDCSSVHPLPNQDLLKQNLFAP